MTRVSHSHGALVQSRLAMMEELQRAQALLGKRMFEACGGAFWHLDLLAAAALNRSVAHCAGIKSLVEARNIMCSGVILRLQIDTVLRFYASSLVSNPQEFAMAVLEGTPVRKMKAKDGKPLQDAYLVQKLGEEYSWVPRVYKETSGYVHFSDKHMLTSLLPDAQRGFRIKVSPVDEDTPEELYLEILEAFFAATDILARYVESWIAFKSKPEMVEGARKARSKLPRLDPSLVSSPSRGRQGSTATARHGIIAQLRRFSGRLRRR